MTQTDAVPMIQQLKDMIAARMGLYFSPERFVDFERGITAAAADFGYSNKEACIKWLLSSEMTSHQIEVLASHLTVGESYFFRDEAIFKALREQIMPDLISRRRGNTQSLRIWSAGCSTGEEPYSIAILIKNLLGDASGWNISVLATDFNPTALKKARQGIYGDWSFRNCPPAIRDKFFEKKQNNYFEILPEVKKMVIFNYLNLALDAFPSVINGTNAIDVILCRNVLMYFTRDTAEKVIDNFGACLVEQGYFIPSPCDFTLGSHPSLVNAEQLGSIIYIKANQSNGQSLSASTLEYSTPDSNEFKVNSEFSIPAEIKTVKKAKNNMQTAQHPTHIEKKQSATETPQQSQYQQALALFDHGAYAAAEKIIEDITVDKTNPETIILLAEIHANLGKLNSALVYCQDAVGKDKSNPRLRYLQANILQEMGKQQEALAALNQTLYLDPDFVLAYFTIGNIAMQQGDTKKSRKYFKNALALLAKHNQDDVLTGSGDISAGRLAEIIHSNIGSETGA